MAVGRGEIAVLPGSIAADTYGANGLEFFGGWARCDVASGILAWVCSIWWPGPG
jgi:hypothetical protein